MVCMCVCVVLFFQAENGIRYLVRSRGLGDVYKRQKITVLIGATSTLAYLLLGSPTSAVCLELLRGFAAVSYTHLTLPTSDLV